MVIIEAVTRKNRKVVKACAEILESCFECYQDKGMEEMKQLLDKKRVLLYAAMDGQVVGLIGAIPQYGVTGWELHPLAVRQEARGQRVGTLLVRALERELKKRGCLTIYLGSDDEENKTSLSSGDLFENTYEKIAQIKNYKRHPYEFYQKMGYKIVGVIPNANGMGKPDIWLATSLAE